MLQQSEISNPTNYLLIKVSLFREPEIERNVVSSLKNNLNLKSFYFHNQLLKVILFNRTLLNITTSQSCKFSKESFIRQ